MEKSQEQIRFENVYLDSKGGFWKHYKPGTMGNIIHWLHVFGTLDIAENVQIGNGEVTWYGRPMLKYRDNPEHPDIPYFYDLNKIYKGKFDFILRSQEIFLNGLEKFSDFVKETDNRYEETLKFINERAKANSDN